MAIVTALSGEVWALRERIATLEALLTAGGQLAPGAVDAHRPGDDETARRAEEAAAFTSRVFRVFEEMREETLAGETEGAYLGIVERAFGEI